MAARRCRLTALPRVSPCLDPQPNEISGADPAEDFEYFRRGFQDPVQPERNAGEQYRVTERGAHDGHQCRPRPARGPGRDHQCHDRSWHDHEHKGDEQEGRKQLVVHIRRAATVMTGTYSSSSPSSDSRSTETTRSSSAVLSTITPCVERPAIRMPDTVVRISLPASVTSITWSASSTGKEPTMRPVFFVSDMATIPLPPRPVVRYSYEDDRLP